MLCRGVSSYAYRVRVRVVGAINCKCIASVVIKIMRNVRKGVRRRGRT